MRTFPFTPSSAQGIHALVTVYQPNATLRVTTAPWDIAYGGNTWIAQGAVNLTQVQFNGDGTATSADVRIASNSAGPIKPGMGSRGLLDGLNIQVQLFDLKNPAAGLFELIPGATVGSVSEDTNGNIILAVQGRLALMGAPMTEVHTMVCRARLGDSRCRMPMIVSDVKRGQAYILQADQGLANSGLWGPDQSWVRKKEGGLYNDRSYECTTAGTTHATIAPTYPTTIGATVTDGTAVFTCRQAYLVASTGQALDVYNIQLDTDVWANLPSVLDFALGMIIPRTGPLKDTRIQIKAYDEGTKIITTWEPYATNNFPPGTEFEVHPGCDRTVEACQSYGNIKNMRATPYAPNSDLQTGRA